MAFPEVTNNIIIIIIIIVIIGKAREFKYQILRIYDDRRSIGSVNGQIQFTIKSILPATKITFRGVRRTQTGRIIDFDVKGSRIGNFDGIL